MCHYFLSQKHYPLNGSADDIQVWCDEELRIVQLQYLSTDGYQAVGGRLGGGPIEKIGLTELGQDVVHQLIQTRIVVDLSPTAKHGRRSRPRKLLNNTASQSLRILSVGATRNQATDAGLLDMLKMPRMKNYFPLRAQGKSSAVMAYGPYLRGPYQEIRMNPPEENIPPATIDTPYRICKRPDGSLFRSYSI